ncbi:MAG: hypothetical protein ABIJ16_08070 [Bacteroidota bacterium]
MNDKKYPEGHFIGRWMAICLVLFSGVGVPLSIVAGSPGFISIGPAIGISMGIAIGTAVEAKKKQQGLIRPLTPEETRRKRIILLAGVALLTAGVVFGLGLIYL